MKNPSEGHTDSFPSSEFWVRVQSRRRTYQRKYEINLKTGLRRVQ